MVKDQFAYLSDMNLHSRSPRTTKGLSNRRYRFLFLALPLGLLGLAFGHRPITWVALGDSITYLNDHTDETGHRLTRGYMTQVTEKLPWVNFINQGHNGWTSGGIARSIETLGLMKADVYTVFLGTNDWWGGNRIGNWTDYANKTGDTTVYGAFRIILDKLRSLNPDAVVILMTPMQRGDFVYINDAHNNAYGSYKDKDGQTLEQVVGAIRDIGKQTHCKVLDLYHNEALGLPGMVKYKRLKDPHTGQYRNYPYPEYIGVPFDPAADEYPYPADAVDVTYDGLHPSDKGDSIIAHQLVKMLKRI